MRKPAEAEKYRLEKIAEAERNRVVLEAEAEAEAQTLRGEAEAYAIEVKAKAEAEQISFLFANKYFNFFLGEGKGRSGADGEEGRRLEGIPGGRPG